jgi:acyl-CoA synthetase (AMP-forming)/AMP-acid ligase II
MFRTTGTPKGVELSHYNVIANSVQCLQKRSLVANTPRGRARRARLDMSGERWMAPLPMYHAFVCSPLPLMMGLQLLTAHPGSNLVLHERGPVRRKGLHNDQV